MPHLVIRRRVLAAFVVGWLLAEPPFAAGAETLGDNLIQNPSVETDGGSGRPAQWSKGGYGNNSRTLTYPVQGFNSPKAVQVAISSWVSGDAKWYFADASVTPGQVYEFSDTYVANAPSILTARFTRSDGTASYQDLATLSPSGAFTTTTNRFTVPASIVSATIFHLINQVGSLTTDNFSLRQVMADAPPPPPSPANLIANPDFESTDGAGQPVSWSKGRWGTNTTTFSYPVPGIQDSKAAKIAITSYTSGDAKWYFAQVPVSRGVYTYATQYQATVPSYLVARFQRQDGTFTYADLGTVTSASAWTPASFKFWIPQSAQQVTIFHLIKSVGQLSVDNTALTLTASPTGVFTTGAVSLVFDDGWVSQYQNAVPKMNAAGMKGTFYIVTKRMAEQGYPGYMSQAQVTELYNQGHEIGAHTRTHRSLITLSDADQQNEINGSRQDLLAMNVGGIFAFAYPFGEYNATTLQLLNAAGFTNARCTMNGMVNPEIPPYELSRLSMEKTTTLDQVKAAIDQAVLNKEWLILTFHQVANNTEQYTVTPALFNQTVDYLVQKGVLVVPVSQGASALT